MSAVANWSSRSATFIARTSTSAPRCSVSSPGGLATACSPIQRSAWEFYRYLGRELGIINTTNTRIDAMTHQMTTTLNGQSAVVRLRPRWPPMLAAKGVKYAAISFVDMHGNGDGAAQPSQSGRPSDRRCSPVPRWTACCRRQR